MNTRHCAKSRSPETSSVHRRQTRKSSLPSALRYISPHSPFLQRTCDQWAHCCASKHLKLVTMSRYLLQLRWRFQTMMCYLPLSTLLFFNICIRKTEITVKLCVCVCACLRFCFVGCKTKWSFLFLSFRRILNVMCSFWVIPRLLSSNSRRFGTDCRFHLHRQVNEVSFIHLPMKMEPTVSSETSAIITQTPGNYPKRNTLQNDHSLHL